MLSYKESLKILKETKALLDGHFVLSSGLHSSQYVQCAKLLSDPEKGKLICSSLAEKIKNSFNNIDIILSPAMGGVIVGYEIARQLKIKHFFVERVDKNFHLRRGFVIEPESNVLIIEDVITTGKSALECFELVKKYKAKVLGYACIIDRSNEKLLIKDKIISQIKLNILTFKPSEIPNDLAKIPTSVPGSRNIS